MNFMNFLKHFLTSSIGQKVVMSLTGIFLVTFLVVHLTGNIQLLLDDNGKQFNLYAAFMTTNPFIKTTSYLLYFGIILHAVQGWLVWKKNKKSRGKQKYAVKVTRTTNTNSYMARKMGWLGTIIFVFILIHLYQFWFKMKMDWLPKVTYDGVEVKNLYAPVAEAYSNIGFVLFYIFCMIVIAMHLWHGLQSAFQTLGVNHRKFGGLIRVIGKMYAILIPAGFALIPIWLFLFR